MTQSRLDYLLVGQFAAKKLTQSEINDKVNARPVKIGIASASDRVVSSDNQYHKRDFKW
ncbi:MAG: hypothetical protein [Caudoviricetes sp.]|nr:MAG: hypothetical protein [Caudoviricetes sp.]